NGPWPPHGQTAQARWLHTIRSTATNYEVACRTQTLAFCAGLCVFLNYPLTISTMRTRPAVSSESESKGRRPLTPWELPSLLTPVHVYRRAAKRRKKERRHYAAILGFVYRNRFAVASQIQRRFSSILRSDRTTRRHLEELEALGYL